MKPSKEIPDNDRKLPTRVSRIKLVSSISRLLLQVSARSERKQAEFLTPYTHPPVLLNLATTNSNNIII